MKVYEHGMIDYEHEMDQITGTRAGNDREIIVYEHGMR